MDQGTPAARALMLWFGTLASLGLWRSRLALVALGLMLPLTVLAVPGCSRQVESSSRPCAGLRMDEDLTPPPTYLESPTTSKLNLGNWIDFLTQPSLAGRHAGSAESRRIAGALADHLAALELPSQWPRLGFCQPFELLDATDFNVAAHITAHTGTSSGNTQATSAPPTVILGAHYDGQGNRGAQWIYPGADDNASGVAALLEVARLLPTRQTTSNVTLIAFGGEETGLLGSSTFWQQLPTEQRTRVGVVVNLDMVGRLLPDGSRGLGYRLAGPGAEQLLPWLQQAAERAATDLQPLVSFGRRAPGRTDAETFNAEVPTLLLSTGLHADYHERTDLPERVDLEQVERATRLVLELLQLPLPLSAGP